jgi:hypothetical protein
VDFTFDPLPRALLLSASDHRRGRFSVLSHRRDHSSKVGRERGGEQRRHRIPYMAFLILNVTVKMKRSSKD